MHNLNQFKQDTAFTYYLIQYCLLKKSFAELKRFKKIKQLKQNLITILMTWDQVFTKRVFPI